MGPALQKGAEFTLITQYCQLKLDEKQEHRISNLKPPVIKSRFFLTVQGVIASRIHRPSPLMPQKPRSKQHFFSTRKLKKSLPALTSTTSRNDNAAVVSKTNTLRSGLVSS